MFLIKNLLLNHSGMRLTLSFLFCLPIHWWWKWYQRSVWEKCFCWHNLNHSAWPWQWRANKLSNIKDMNVWGVNSIVTKHSDYFIWKYISVRITRRFDDTVHKKQVNSWILKYLFWREVSILCFLSLCLFVVIKPENPYFASLPVLEVI